MTDTGEETGGRPDDGVDDEFDPISFLEAAVRTPSHETVDGMRELVLETLSETGIDAETVSGGCVVAEKTAPQPEEAPHLVLNTHLDTVTPHVPFERGRMGDADVIRGRGACDAKGPLAALLAAFLAAEPDRGRLTLAVTPDEEVLSLGAAALVGKLDGSDDRLEGDLFIVGEPTGLDVCTAAKGRFQGTVKLSGTAAHAAAVTDGNAIAAAEGALRAIRTFDDDAAEHPQLGAPKLTPTVIEGGDASNQIPAECAITVDRRCVPPETAAGFRSSLAADIDAATPEAVGVAFELTDRDSPFFEAFSTETGHELVTTTVDAVREMGPDLGLQPSRGGAVRPFGAATEASYFAPAPTIVFGPGDLADDDGAVAHAEWEYVRVREVEAAAAIVERVIDDIL